MKKVFSFLILSTWLVGLSHANQATSSASIKSISKKWSAATYLDTRSGIENQTGAPASLTSTFQGFLYYNLGQGYTARMMVGAYHDFRNQEKQNGLYNSYLALSKSFRLNSSLTLSGDTRVYLPLNRIERENHSFRTKIYIAPKVSLNLKSFGLKKFTVSYELITSRNIHQYETGKAGYVNVRNLFAHEIDVKYQATERLKFTTFFRNTHQWTYYGTRKPDAFMFELNSSYLIAKDLTIGLGYTVGDTTFGYDGTSLNIDLLDLTKLSIYTSLTYVF